MVLTDRGDVVALLDENGSPFAAYRYDAWGNPLGAGNVPDSTGIWAQQTLDLQQQVVVSADLAAEIATRQVLRYASYCFDAESGMYYLSSRHYDPATRQFLSKDLSRNDGEQSAYGYCLGNPIKYVDPTGYGVLETLAAATWKYRIARQWVQYLIAHGHIRWGYFSPALVRAINNELRAQQCYRRALHNFVTVADWVGGRRGNGSGGGGMSYPVLQALNDPMNSITPRLTSAERFWSAVERANRVAEAESASSSKTDGSVGAGGLVTGVEGGLLAASSHKATALGFGATLLGVIVSGVSGHEPDAGDWVATTAGLATSAAVALYPAVVNPYLAPAVALVTFFYYLFN